MPEVSSTKFQEPVSDIYLVPDFTIVAGAAARALPALPVLDRTSREVIITNLSDGTLNGMLRVGDADDPPAADRGLLVQPGATLTIEWKKPERLRLFSMGGYNDVTCSVCIVPDKQPPGP